MTIPTTNSKFFTGIVTELSNGLATITNGKATWYVAANEHLTKNHVGITIRFWAECEPAEHHSVRPTKIVMLAEQ